MNIYDQQVILRIHKSIHDRSKVKILLPEEGTSLEIRKANNGCRMASWRGYTFMEQNKSKNSVYADKARNGARITWGMSQQYPWIRIEDEQIKNPQAWPHQ